MCQSEDKVSTTLEQSSFPPTALKGDGRAYSSAAGCIIVAVPIGTDNTNRTKMGNITPEQGSFPTDRTKGGRSRPLQWYCSLHYRRYTHRYQPHEDGQYNPRPADDAICKVIGGDTECPLRVCHLSRSSESTHFLCLRRYVALFDSTRAPDGF